MTAEGTHSAPARTGSGHVPPLGHYGTCAICGEATTWCMAGYWTHDEDRPHDHQAVTYDD